MTAVGATLRLRREGALRSRAARGDAAAFAAVYERHHQALYRYCRSILRHEQDAQDALQSTFARAFAALQDERRDFELKPWLFRIAHNEAISILRRRRETSELDDVAGVEGETEDRVSEREELRLLQLDLADLPDRQRSALILRELNGLSHAEIGTVLELSPAAVKQSIFEARTALFSCREGREMACHDVRRMLSDGDGRVLRGRGVRAHLRSCPDCRRFKADLQQRPAALRMLAPPLPTAGAAALLAQLLGGSSTAVKLLACVAIAGGGTTVAAIEMHDVPKPTPLEAEAASRTTPAARKPAPAAVVVPVKTSAPQPTAPTRSVPPQETARAGKPAGRRGKRAAGRRKAENKRRRPVTSVPANDRARQAPGKPESAGKPEHAGKPASPSKSTGKPEHAAKPAHAGQSGKPAHAGQSGKPEHAADPQHAAKPETPHSQAKKEAAAEPTPVAAEEPQLNKGQAKKAERQ
ncbi:MAG TPA: sigma-70 family RNA polymerase sigma factor [Solirubrobacter sp.]|nr:sigma-70 family RNA polymerase sigma factor [Solirubrobacter sp.]